MAWGLDCFYEPLRRVNRSFAWAWRIPYSLSAPLIATSQSESLLIRVASSRIASASAALGTGSASAKLDFRVDDMHKLTILNLNFNRLG